MESDDLLDQWLDFVATEPHKSSFTFELCAQTELRDRNCTEVSRLWEAFARFLRSELFDGSGGLRPIEDVFATPSLVLTKFHESTSENLSIAGPPVLVGGRRLATQQNLGALRYSNWIQELYPAFTARMTPIFNMLANSPINGSRHDFKLWYTKLQNEIRQLVEQLQNEEPQGDQDFEWDADLATEELEERVIWATFEDEMEAMVNPGALTSSSATSSHVMAIQRYGAGLFHDSDIEDEESYIDRFLAESENGKKANIIAFKTFVQIIFHPDPDMVVSQPTTFSGGYPDLYLSYPVDHDLGGRACRLARIGCTHSQCKCATEGLPEIVTTAANLAENAKTQIGDIVPMRARHLKRYHKPAIPFIREQRGIA